MTSTATPASQGAATGTPTAEGTPAVTSTVSRAVSEPDQPLKVRVHHPGNRALVLEASGAVDTTSEPLLAQILRQRLDSFAAMLVLDLSGVTFLNTEGMMTLLDAAHYARIRAKPLVLITGPAVDRLLEILEITDQFTSAPTTQAALRSSPTTARSMPQY